MIQKYCSYQLSDSSCEMVITNKTKCIGKLKYQFSMAIEGVEADENNSKNEEFECINLV